MHASNRTRFITTSSLLGAGLLAILGGAPAVLTAQKTAVQVDLPAHKTRSAAPSMNVIIPAPPALHHGAVQIGAMAAGDADDVRQDANDPRQAQDATTGQDLTWDADKRSWIDAKSGEPLGFSGRQTSEGVIIPAPPIMHHGLVVPAAEGVNPRVGADAVQQYDSDPDHAYNRTMHQSLYWDAKRQSWVEVQTGHVLGFDGAPIASAMPAPRAVVAAQTPAPAPASTSQAPMIGMRSDYASSFTLGWAGGVTWLKGTGPLAGANPATITSIGLPSQQYIVQWNMARSLSLGMYVGGAYLRQSALSGLPSASSTNVNFGLEPEFYFLGHNRARDVRVFVGPGLWYNYANVSGGTSSGSAYQFAASGIVGAELPLWREGRMRVGVEYGHDFQNTADNMAAANYYGLDLGLMFDAPSGLVDDYTDYENAYLPSFSIRYGSALGFTSFGAMGGVSEPSQYSVALPTATVGGYAGLGSTRQLRVGTELDFSRLSAAGASTTYLGLEPGVEYYLMPHAYKGWDVRVRGFGILQYEAADGVLGYTPSSHGWMSGYGAEAMLTHHFLGPQLVGFGLSYAHVGDDASLGEPSQNTLNLKFSIDSRLF